MKLLRKFRRGCRWILILSIVVLLLTCLLIIFLLIRKPVSAAVGQQPWDVILLLDQSNSMSDSGGQGSDPERLRAEAAGLIITSLALAEQQHDHRLGIIHFGTDSWLASPLRDLHDPTERDALRAALVAAEPMGWTDPLKALALAYAQLYPKGDLLSAGQESNDFSSQNRRQAIILITDGRPDLPTLVTAAQKAAYVAELRALIAQFQARHCAIFTIAISTAAITPDDEVPTFYRNLWQEIAANTPPAVYYEVHTADDLPQVYYSIAVQLFGAEPHLPEIEATVDGVSVNELWIETGLHRVTFIVFKREPATQVEIRRPGGALVRDDDPDVQHLSGGRNSHDEVWAIEQPREGRWIVTFRGAGHVMLWKDEVRLPDVKTPAFTLDVQVPQYIAEAQPLVLSVVVQDEHGDRINNADIQVTAELRRAGFSEALLLFHSTRNGIYGIERSDLSPGAYTVLVRALRDGRFLARHELAFSIVALPQLVINAPQPGLSLSTRQPLTVTVQVRSGLALLDAPALAALGTLTATLHGPDHFSQSVPLLARANRTFEAYPDIPDSIGHYTLTLRLAGTTPEGLTFTEQSAILLNARGVSKRPEAQTLPGWPLWLATGGGVVGLAGLWMRRRQPVLEGQWRVLCAPEGQRTGAILPIPPARRTVLLGGNRLSSACIIALTGIPSPIARLHPARDRHGAVEVWLTPLSDAASELLYNDHPIIGPHRLQDGDVIVTTGYRLRYENVRQAAARRQYASQSSKRSETARRWSI